MHMWRTYRWFLVWLGVVYLAWAALVVAGAAWPQVVDRGGIAVAMLFGSFVAGSTPMGGGTVGFPVLVVVFNGPATLGRDFALSIQSVGMVSASIFLLARRQPLAWPVLWPALGGSCLGTLLGIVAVAPFIDDLVVKLTFSVLWVSFGLMTLRRLRELEQLTEHPRVASAAQTWLYATTGFVGGIIAAVTGVGIDMLVYALLVTLDRCDLKVAIPTSVVLMAGTSLLGVAYKTMLAAAGWPQLGIDPSVYYYWLAAAPVVALGAPFGALVVHRIGRLPTLVFVALLCIWQFVWIAWHERLSLATLVSALAAVGALYLFFNWLHQVGCRQPIPCPETI
ncbi:MAG: sulfite exporter TauE/SafE family protein [Planctomycetota bacterium]|nr:MAG: sulfite exporter TauE/SafE family protein [Planctomycetota bacterium]